MLRAARGFPASRWTTGLFARAERLIAERNYADAISFCQLQLAASPRCVTLRLLLARALLAQRQTLTAVAQLHACLQIDSSCAEARRLLAEQRRPPSSAGPPRPSLLDEDADRPTTPRQRSTPAPAPSSPPESPLPEIKPVLLPSAMKRAAMPAAKPEPRPQPRPAVKPESRAQPRPATKPEPRAQPRPATKPEPRAAGRPVAAVEPRPEPKPEPIVLAPPPRPVVLTPLPPAPSAEPARSSSFSSPPTPVRATSRRRNAFASPPADVPSTRWQRPLSIESRRPQPLWRIALVAAVLAGLGALFTLRPDAPAALPTAAIAQAVRPSPEPPVAAKPDRDLLVDVWIHPLAGPERRMPVRDSRLFGAEREGDRPTECRGGHCGIDLEGRYGEPVYAVHDGVVDRVQRAANPDHGGHYVRLAHQNGTVITQYFHLSSIPRRLEEGAQVKAGDVIGFVGLSGVRHSEPHLHFTISVQDSSGADGRYLDPEPLIALWPVRASAADDHLRVLTAPPGLARGFLRHRHRHRVAQAAAE